MISKSPKEIALTTSKNLQTKGFEVSEQTVKEFNTFLFSKVLDMMQSLEHLEVYVPKLGTWRFRRRRCDDLVRDIANKNMKLLLKHQGEEIAERAQQSYMTRLNKVKKLIERHHEMITEKCAFKGIKNGSKYNKRGFQEPLQNMGGLEE